MTEGSRGRRPRQEPNGAAALAKKRQRFPAERGAPMVGLSVARGSPLQRGRDASTLP